MCNSGCQAGAHLNGAKNTVQDHQLQQKQEHFKVVNLRDNRLTEQGVQEILRTVAGQAEQIDLSENDLAGEAAFQQIMASMGGYGSKLR